MDGQPTVVLPAAAGGRRLPRCANSPCGRPAGGSSWCCWVCEAAHRGGWHLRPYDPAEHWTDVHTRECEEQARARDPAWYAASARPGQPAPPVLPPLRQEPQ